MKNSKRSGAPPQHHFFHAMVLMGGTVALGCGGVVSRSGGSDSENGVAGAAGTGQAGGTDSAGIGGTSSFGGGGTSSFGGGGTSSFGGASSGGDPGLFGTGGLYGTGGVPIVDGGLLPCVSAEWDCGSGQLMCDYARQGYLVASNLAACTCNGSRPRSEADCNPGEAFVCERGSFDSDGGVTEVRFQCACLVGATDCSVCAGGFAEDCQVSAAGVDGRLPDILCGCAVVLLQ